MRNTSRNHRQGAPVVTVEAVETAAMKKRRRLRALVRYRQLLGVAGRPRVWDDGVMVRRGASKRVQKKLDAGGGVKPELMMRRTGISRTESFWAAGSSLMGGLSGIDRGLAGPARRNGRRGRAGLVRTGGN